MVIKTDSQEFAVRLFYFPLYFFVCSIVFSFRQFALRTFIGACLTMPFFLGLHSVSIQAGKSILMRFILLERLFL